MSTEERRQSTLFNIMQANHGSAPVSSTVVVGDSIVMRDLIHSAAAFLLASIDENPEDPVLTAIDRNFRDLNVANGVEMMRCTLAELLYAYVQAQLDGPPGHTFLTYEPESRRLIADALIVFQNWKERKFASMPEDERERHVQTRLEQMNYAALSSRLLNSRP